MIAIVDRGIRLACLATFASFFMASLSAKAIAQSSSELVTSPTDTDCHSLFNDDTLLTEQNVSGAIACHRNSTEGIERLVMQLHRERSNLTSQLREQEPLLAKLTKEQAELIQQADSLRSQLAAAEKTNDVSTQKIEKVEDQNNRLHKELDKFQEQLSSSQDQLSSSQHQLSNSQEKLSDLQDQLRTANEEISANQSELSLSREQLQSTGEKLKDNQEQLRLLQSEYADLEDILKTKEQTFELALLDSENKLEQLTAEALNTQLTIQNLEEQNSTLEAETKQLASDAAEQKSSLTAAMADSEAALKAAKAELEARTNTQTAENLQLASTISTLKERLTSREQRIAELRIQQHQKNKQTAQFILEHETESKQLSDTLAKTEAALTTELADAQLELDNSLSDNTALKSTITDLESQSSEISAQLAKVQAETTLANKTLRQKDEQLTAKETKITEIEAALAAATDENNSLLNKAKMLEETYLTIQRLEEQNSTLEAETKQLASAAAEQKSSLTAAMADSEAALKAEKAELEARTNTQTAENLQLASTISTLKERLTSREQRIAELRIQQHRKSKQTEQFMLERETESKQLSDTLAKTEAALTTELADAQQKLNNSLSDNSALKSTITDLESRSSEISAQLTKLQAETTLANETLQQKDEQLSAKETQIAKIEAALADAADEKNSLTNKAKLLEGNLASVKDLLQQSQANNEAVASDLEKMRTDLRASDDRLADRKSALAELVSEKRANVAALAAHKNASTALTDTIKSQLLAAGLSNANVQLQEEDHTIAISVGSNTLFRPGSSLLTADGATVLASVGSIISDIEDRRVTIEGHSDNTPLGARLEKTFVDNWGLSMARAVSTANFLNRKSGIPPERLSVIGLGDTEPVADNATVEGRQQNRRVDILLVDTGMF